jgi:hypothetical protein
MCCPNITDADVINTFLSGTTNKTLVHKLGWKSPWTTNERLDITPSHASNEDAVGSIVDCSKGKAKRNEDADEGASNCYSKKKKNKERHEGSLVATTE